MIQSLRHYAQTLFPSKSDAILMALALTEISCLSSESAAYYANLYRQHQLTGGHVIKLGPGNEEAALEALRAWPGGLQIGGQITIDNAKSWIEAGAAKVEQSLCTARHGSDK
jgi:phosphoribosylformimino-5-aminoimidazole carboxamide ribonucleotide (ProFAR) isomerase